MDSSRHVVAVLSPEFPQKLLAAIEWKKTVADDPNKNNKKKAPYRRVSCSLLLRLLSSTEML